MDNFVSVQQAVTQKTEASAKHLWPWLLSAIIVVGFVVVVLANIFAPSRVLWTDDAYITAHYAIVSPRIAGQVTGVLVTDNQVVKQGQTIALIDDRDFRAAYDQSQAMLQAARAQLANTNAELARQPSIIAQAQAQLESAEAQLVFTRQNDARYVSAAASGAATYQDRQQADTELRQAVAAVAAQRAAVTAAQQQIAILQAQQQAAAADVGATEASFRQAGLNLSYTRIVSAFDGTIGELSVQAGDYVTPGAGLMALIPLQQIYIVANYREVAFKHLVPGEHVRVHVDAYNLDLDGVVNSIPPASGASFAPIEPNNATGNFTKIVQRLPVKITFTPDQPALSLLRVGMSVETTIDTRAPQQTQLVDDQRTSEIKGMGE